jgi:hypothetical protein
MRKLVASRCEQIQDQLRNEVASRGGIVKHSDGKRYLEMVETTKRTINVDEDSLPILKNAMGEDWTLAMRVTKTDAEKIIKDNVLDGAPRGSKGKAVKAFYERLDDVGSVSVVPEFRLEIHTEK